MTTMSKMPVVDPSNAETARAWDGDEGAFWAAEAEKFDRSLAGYHQSLMEAAGIQRADRVLDVGCGTGQATRDAATRAPSGEALGVDLSSAMLEVARRLAEEQRIGNVRFERADAQVHPFPDGAFDVVLSRTGTMFFGDRQAAFANLGRALRPGGGLTMLVWQGPGPNEWIRALAGALAAGRDLPLPPVGVRGPFALADPDHVRELLTSTGFDRVELEPREEPIWFGTNATEGEAFVLGVMGWMLRDLDETGRARALGDLRATLRAHETDTGVLFGSGAWLVRAEARR